MRNASHSLNKSASKGAIASRLHGLVRDGFWRTAGKKWSPTDSGFKGWANRASRHFYNPTTDKSTLLSKGLTGYGFAGVGTNIAGGPNLPGSDLAFNTTMPGIGLLFTAPNVIKSMRMGSEKNQQDLIEDGKIGARAAASDLLTLGMADNRYLTSPNLYSQFMRQQDPRSAQLVDDYRQGAVQPLGGWGTLSSIFGNSQNLVNNQIDTRIQGLLKSGSMEKSAIPILRGAKSFGGRLVQDVLPWAGVGLGGFTLGSSIFGKPYDARAVQQRGYAGAQAKLQNELNNMGSLSRLGLRLDPTLLAGKIEKHLPGTIDHWEKLHGKKFSPGWLSGIAGNWERGGDAPGFYEYDAKKQRHYY